MKTNNYLSLQRSFLYTRQYLSRNYITLLIGFVLAFLAGLIFIYMFLNGRDDSPHIKEGIEGILKFFYWFSLFGMGFIFTSITFNDNQSKARKIWNLSLPVSILERLVSMLLISTVGFVIIYLPMYYVFETTIKTIAYSSYNVSITFDLLTKENFKIISQYFVLQSVFLTGAAYFHRNSFIKTGLIIIAFFMILFWTDYQFHKLAYRSFSGYKPVFDLITKDYNSFQISEYVFSTIQSLYNIFFYALLAPLFWIITYLRLKEEEV